VTPGRRAEIDLAAAPRTSPEATVFVKIYLAARNRKNKTPARPADTAKRV
jgi:hypothetical protein